MGSILVCYTLSEAKEHAATADGQRGEGQSWHQCHVTSYHWARGGAKMRASLLPPFLSKSFQRASQLPGPGCEAANCTPSAPRACRSVSSVSSGCRVLSRCLASKVSRYPRWQDAVAAHNKTWAAVAKLFHPLVAASQSCTPVDVAQPVSTTSILCGHLRTSSSLVPGVIATAQGAVQAQHLRLQHTPCSSVAAAASSPLQRRRRTKRN